MNRPINLVILAGGKGTRISNYLNNHPKPMAKFNNLYFLEYVVNTFAKYNFNNIYILTGYKYKIIHKKFNKKMINFSNITCLKEKKLMGTGGALFNLKKKINGDFVLVNGDTLFDVNINNFLKNVKKKDLCKVALVKKNSFNNSSKLNNLSIKNKKIYFDKKGKFINGGVYYFKKNFLNYIKNKHSSLENDILPKLIKNNLVIGEVYSDFFLDIGTPKNFKSASKLLLNYFYKPAAFLDRDGVINYDYGHVYKFKKFILRKNVLKGLKFLIKKGFYLFIVTNQAGIAKGYYKEKDFYILHKKIKIFLSKSDVFLHDVKFSPFHPDSLFKRYKKKSLLRKPGNLMIKKIFRSWHVNKKKSFMIGDKKSDELASNKSKLYFEYAKKDFYLQVKNISKKFNNY